MSLNRSEKAAVVEEVTSLAAKSQTLVMAEYRGITVADMTKATGWQAHSVRGALSGTIAKKLGLKVVSEKLADRGRVYRLG